MALVRSYQSSEDQTGDIIYVTDETGTYDAISNPGGYGAPNTERTDVALIAIAKYKALSGDVTVDLEAYDPEDVTQFELQGRSSENYEGHYQFDIYSVPIKTGAETPADDDFVYDATGDELQRWDGAAWVSAENSELEDNDWDHDTLDIIHQPNIWMAFNNVNKLLVIGCKSVKRSDLQQDLMTLSNILNGSIGLFAEGSYDAYQNAIETYISRAVYLRDLTA